jgi:hypothetical protein
MQRIDLPSSFQGQTLTEFRLTSTGGILISDASIQGLTVQTVATPAPPSAVLLGTGSLLLGVTAGFRRWRHA